MDQNPICPIWGTNVFKVPQIKHIGVTVDSPRAGGKYWISDQALEILKKHDEQLRARLTSWLIEQRCLGEQYPEITTDTIEDAEKRRDLGVRERADRLLGYVERSTSSIGDQFVRPHDDRHPTFLEMLAWSESTRRNELDFLLSYLEEKNWLKEILATLEASEYTLKVEGYAHLDELEHRATDSSKVFVAMRFDTRWTRRGKKASIPRSRMPDTNPYESTEKST